MPAKILILSVLLVLAIAGCSTPAGHAVQDADNWVQKVLW